MSSNSVQEALERSNQLDDALFVHLENIDHDGSARAGLTVVICSVAFEHWLSLRQLMALGNRTSAIALLRLQFESLVRATWILYAANKTWLDKLSAPLTADAEHAAKNGPTLEKMMDAIEAPNPGAGVMLKGFHAANWKSLNSFIHAGIHPVAGVKDGYADSFLKQIIENSNAVAMMTAATVTLLSDDPPLQMKALTPIQLEFKDCMPEFVPSPVKLN